MFVPYRVWRWLTEPPASMERPELRRRTHLLLSILASLVVVWVVAVAAIVLRIGFAGANPSGADLSATTSLMYLSGGAVVFFSYLLARWGRYTVASRLLVGVALTLSFLQIAITRDVQTIDFPLNAIVLCSLLLPPADMGATYALTIVGYLSVPYIIPSVTMSDMISILMVAFFIGGVSFAATLIHERDLRQLENQASQMAKDAKRLMETRKMETVARMAAGVAHEFNNILMAITGYAEIMERRAKGIAIDDAKGILAASRQGSRLTEQLLSFSQQQLMKPTVVNIDDLLRNRERHLSESMRPETRLLLRSSPEPIVLHIDGDLFCEALHALVRKAEENIPDHGTITIRSKVVDLPPDSGSYLPPGPYCAITISNSGPRGAGTVENRMLEPLLEDTEIATEDINVAAAYGIVRQVGGQIETRADPELGTVCVVTVPRMDSSGKSSVLDR